MMLERVPSDVRDGLQHDVRRLHGEDRVRVDRLALQHLLLELLGELAALALELVDRRTGDREDRVLGLGRAALAGWKIASVAKPSGRNSLTAPLFGPSTATLSLISWPLFSSTSPPTKTASGFVPLIFVNRASKFAERGSYAAKPTT